MHTIVQCFGVFNRHWFINTIEVVKHQSIKQTEALLDYLSKVASHTHLQFKGYYSSNTIAMHRVGNAGNGSNSSRPKKEKRFTYVINDAGDTMHCAGINCLSILKSTNHDCDYLFTGSRDGTLKRWSLANNESSFSAKFESHADWVNDVVLSGNSIVSCSSDTTLKVWNCLSDGACTRTFRQHSDYVTCLAAAEKNKNIVASGGLGGEVFVWDIEASLLPTIQSPDRMDEESSNGVVSTVSSGNPVTSLHSINSSSNISLQAIQPHGYSPVPARGHKESVYALAMNETGTLLASGGIEKVVRVWDPRTGSKNMKLRGHTDNIRALLVDSTGRFCLSGSSDSMIRLWDLGQQRCVHSYAVHTDSVWTLASTPTFSHVYSGGRDLSLYLTDLATREALLLCTEEHPILQLTLQDDSIWAATTDSSVNRWPADGNNPQKVFDRGGSFLAGNLFTRARSYLEGSSPAPVHKQPSLTIPGVPGIVQHEILNNRRHVMTKDVAGSVKLWDITRGVVLEDFGKVPFDQKKEELFEKISIPAWFTADSRLGCLSIHLETPQCFSAEMYSIDLNISGASEDHKINLAQETLRSLLAQYLSNKRQIYGSQVPAVNDAPLSVGRRDLSFRSQSSHSHLRMEVDDVSEDHNMMVLPAFEFSTISPPSIITEGSQGGPWRKKINELDGTEDENDFPRWCLDCVLNGRMPQKENTKCSFYIKPCEGSGAQVLTQGKLSAPRILRIHKVVSYVLDKMFQDRTLEPGELGQNGAHTLLQSVSAVSFSSGSKSLPKKAIVEILCNNQVLTPDMSLATVKAYIWKKSEDLILNYRVVQA